MNSTLATIVASLALTACSLHADFELVSSTINNGGGTITAADYEVTSSIGDTVQTATLQGGDFTIKSGFIPTLLPPPGCAGDANGDNSVDFQDLDIVLDKWATSVAPGTDGDLDGSGFVDFQDLDLILDRWGTTCN